MFQPLNTFNQNILKELFSSRVEQKQIWNFYPAHKARIVLLQLALVVPKRNLKKAGLKKDWDKNVDQNLLFRYEREHFH